MNEKSAQSEKAIDYGSLDLDDPALPAAIDATAFSSGGYPYADRMPRKAYDEELMALQIELLKLQRWAQQTGERIVILFEGRDAAGKGGNIRRFTQHLNPRHAKVVALSKPTEAEQGQWYFQRYVAHLPTAGDMALFDRSWYNRAGVEPVMGFCTPEQTKKFLEEVPEFESALVRDGVRLFKFWLTVGRAMQWRRFHARRHDPLKSWKLSPVDYASIPMWDDYTQARDAMLKQTHTEVAPWTIIRANDKRRARLSTIRTVLNALDYSEKDAKVVDQPDPKIAGSDDRFFADA